MRLSSLLTVIILATTTASAFAANSTLGLYRMNIAQSSYSPAPNPLKDLTVTRESSSDGITQTTTGTLAGDVPFRATYSSKGDGVEVPVTGNTPFDTIAVTQIDLATVMDQRRSSVGKPYKASGRTIFTHHGKLMTVTIQGIGGNGKQFTQVLVFDKQVFDKQISVRQ
jgi:hypothetical protein